MSSEGGREQRRIDGAAENRPENEAFNDSADDGRISGVRERLLFPVKLALGLGIFYWLWSTGRFDPRTYQGLTTASAGGLLIALLLTQALSLTISLSRWWFLLRAQGIEMSFRESLLLGYRGTFLGLLLPGTVGADGLRFLALRKHYRPQLTRGAASILLDRALGFLGLILIALVFIAVALGGSNLGNSLAVLLFLGLILLATLTSLGVALGFIPLLGEHWLRRSDSLAAFLDALKTYREQRQALITVLVMSAASHLLTTVAAMLGLSAMGVDFSYLGIAAVTPVLIVLRFLPLTPLGLGITDAAGEELYGLLGVVAGAENQMLLRGSWLVLAGLCGLAFFLRDKTHTHPDRNN